MKTTGHTIKWDHFARFCFVFRVDFGDLTVAKVMFSKMSESKTRYFENITFASFKSPK